MLLQTSSWSEKSVVLVVGENKKVNEKNALKRNFKLGNEKVKERVNYEHLGV